MRAWSASAAELLSFHFKYERFVTAADSLQAHRGFAGSSHLISCFHLKVINLKSRGVVTWDVQLHIPMATSSENPPLQMAVICVEAP